MRAGKHALNREWAVRSNIPGLNMFKSLIKSNQRLPVRPTAPWYLALKAAYWFMFTLGTESVKTHEAEDRIDGVLHHFSSSMRFVSESLKWPLKTSAVPDTTAQHWHLMKRFDVGEVTPHTHTARNEYVRADWRFGTNLIIKTNPFIHSFICLQHAFILYIKRISKVCGKSNAVSRIQLSLMNSDLWRRWWRW